MVLHVCKGILRDHHAAEDAFQATFLTLARKASSIGHGAGLAPWLSAFAYRIGRGHGSTRPHAASGTSAGHCAASGVGQRPR